jgi:signal peptidase II
MEFAPIAKKTFQLNAFAPTRKRTLALNVTESKFLGGGMKIKTKFVFLFAILVAVDQISKYFSSSSVCNKNIAWSIPIAPAIFYFVWVLIMIILIYLISKKNFYIQKFFIVLIFSGAISNMIDRIRLGCVVDYIDLKFWPVFNLADVYISVGIILFLFVIARERSDRGNPVQY